MSPWFTEESLPDQSSKVFIVTGATSGVGQLLAGALYSKNAKVYLAVRSEDKVKATISSIKSQHPKSKGELIFLKLDLNDLTTIKGSATEFLRKESRLDVLFNNAGVMIPPQGSKTAQGHELQLGTNDLAPFLFTKLLYPILRDTAKTAPTSAVRVVWVASSAAARFSPKDGIVMDNLDYKKDQSAWHKYGVSKAGNILHGAEYARKHAADGIVSVSLDPGNLKTDLYRHVPWWQKPIFNLVLKDPIYGAYTEMFAGFSPEITIENSGTFIEPYGKIGKTRADIEVSMKSKGDGGNGLAEQFWEWTEKQIAPYH